MRKIQSAIVLALLLLSATVTLTFAWPEGPPVKVLIKGPGIEGEVEVGDQQSLGGWAQSS